MVYLDPFFFFGIRIFLKQRKFIKVFKDVKNREFPGFVLSYRIKVYVENKLKNITIFRSRSSSEP